MSTDKTPAEKLRERARELAGPHASADRTLPWCLSLQGLSCTCGQAQRAEAIAALIRGERIPPAMDRMTAREATPAEKLLALADWEDFTEGNPDSMDTWRHAERLAAALKVCVEGLESIDRDYDIPRVKVFLSKAAHLASEGKE